MPEWDRVIWRMYTRARMRLGAAILGRGWLGVMTALLIIDKRARDCITPDGRVILANCQPLADALYAQIPGIWTFTATEAEKVR